MVPLHLGVYIFIFKRIFIDLKYIFIFAHKNNFKRHTKLTPKPHFGYNNQSYSHSLLMKSSSGNLWQAAKF